MNAIIWGINGQDGFYLSELLSNAGIKVVGVGRSGTAGDPKIDDFESVSKLIKDIRPDYIFHLAANSTTQHYAWKENHETISTGTLNILEAVREFSPGTKVFLSGSGLQFKNTGVPIKETDVFVATSSYAVSRIHTVYVARYYRQLGLKVYIGYFFNHDSPRRSERHINKKIVNTAKRIAQGSGETLVIGDLSVKKEFGFAGDVVQAVWLLVQQENIEEAVIGTGKAYSIEEWVNICFSLFDLNWRDHVVLSNDYVAEYKVLVSDPSRIHSLGWRAKTDILELAKMMSE